VRSEQPPVQSVVPFEKNLPNNENDEDVQKEGGAA